MGFVFPPIVEIALGLLVLAGAAWDLRSRRVPNGLVLAGFLFGVALNSFLYGESGLWSALLGAALAILVYLPIHALGGIGAGDVKLMAAVGALVGPANWIRIFIFTAAAGLLLAVVAMIWKHRLGRTLSNLAGILGQLAQGRAPRRRNPEWYYQSGVALTFPHAVTIAIGCVVYLVAASAGSPH